MSRILLLTRCIFAENELENIIRSLGYEVFVTSSLIEAVQQKTLSEKFLQDFQLVILSQTIPHTQQHKLIQSLKKYRMIIVQVDQEEIQDQGAKNVLTIQPNMSFIELREVLNNGETLFYKYQSGNQTLYRLLEQLDLSGREEQLLQELVSAIGQVVTRETLTQKIWQGEVNNSTKGQLSSLVRRIKDKMKEAGFDSSTLQSVHGKGYMLKA